MRGAIYIITYDITDDRRRTKVYEILSDYGKWVGYSVFECMLPPEKFVHLTGELESIIDKNEDSIRIYRVCERDFSQRKILGQDKSIDFKSAKTFVIG